MGYAHLMAGKENWFAVVGLYLWAIFLTIISTYADPEDLTRPTTQLIASKLGLAFAIFMMSWVISHLIRKLKKEDTPTQHYRRWGITLAVMAFLIWNGLKSGITFNAALFGITH